ncbi:hypothetical protein GGX14DRAFT_470089 [Mycena pura]|uniref:MYND-type domain-containing protein n=1 Tax=Mycena pura TaxID=153505 RepID=A0AAD6Y5U7_9AGAR|nr:hypothetical protein GGX14DRAFT_470089 [Mycena pura]
MHPDLALDALKKLPLCYRYYAKKAAHGSMPDMDKVISQCETLPEESHLFLPVVFANLDPRRIPGDQLLGTAALPPTASSPIILALESLELLLCMGIDEVDPAAYTALWPRAWEWIQFLEVYHAFLPEPQTFAEVGARIVAPLRSILMDPRSAAIVHSTPGVYRLFARIWMVLPCTRAIVLEPDKVTYVTHAEAALLALYGFIGDSLWMPQMVFEFVEGAGGADALASRLVADLATFVPPLCRVAYTASNIFAALLNFVSHVAVMDQSPMPLEHLLAAGLTRTLTHTLIPLCAMEASAFSLAEASLETLVIAFTSPGWSKYLPESMEAGLLAALVTIMQSPRSDVVLDLAEQLVRDILPGAFVFRPVIAAARGRVPNVTEPRGFRRQSLYVNWVKLRDVAVERVGALDHFESAAYTRMRMCDNPECGQIKAAKEMKKCSGCLLPHYCGPECQKSDWKLKHREYCAAIRKGTKHVRNPLDSFSLRRRTDRFLRFLLLRDYRANKLKILLEQLWRLHQKRSAQLSTVFNYTEGRCSIAVREDEEHLQDRRSTWEEINHGGQRHIGWHHIVFDAGGAFRYPERQQHHDYLLRSPSTALSDGLLRLADLLPEDADVSRLEWDWPEVYAEVVRLSELEIEEVY